MTVMLEHMFGLVERVRELVRALVGALDPATISGPDAVRLLDALAEMERLIAGAKAQVAARATETNQWRRDGDRSPEHWLARRSGSTVGAAKDVLATAERLKDLPAVAEAVRDGQLSVTQAAIVADAAVADPAAERALLAAARAASVAELRRTADAVKAAVRSAEDEAARQERIHRGRKAWLAEGPDGSHEVHAQGPKAEIAAFWARLQPFIDEQFQRARTEGRREPAEAYAFDALLAMSRAGGSTKSPAKVIVRVDLPAVRRGTTVPGERCEIAGYGPIPVSEALKLMPEAFLALVLTRGTDVINVTHLGRRFTEHQKTALEWTDPECQVLGCASTVRLEKDHRDDWALTHQTTIRSADRLCHHHHLLKTAGWRLEEGEGKRRLVPPEPTRALAMAGGP